MKLILVISIFLTFSNALFSQNDFLYDNELIKKNKVQSAEAKLNSYRNDKVDSIFSNITHYEFNKLGQILKETYTDYSNELVQMYITYDYNEKCSKIYQYEWYSTEDFNQFYSLMKTLNFYNDNCELFNVKYYELGNFVEEETYQRKFKNEKLVFEEITINNSDKKFINHNYLDDLTVETIIYFNNLPEEKYINFYNKNNDVIKFCDYSTTEVYCGKTDYIYNNKNKVQRESYFNQHEKLDHILEFNYLENGLLNEKTTYLVNEKGELFLSSIVTYSYKYFK